MKIKEFFNLEDPNRPYLAPNYWLLKRIGFILPKNWFAKASYIFLHEFVGLFVLSQYMELYFIKSDLDEVITNLKISMLSIVCVVKANTFTFWQKSWREVIDYVTKEDIYERENKDARRGQILDSYTQYSRRVTYFYWCLVFTTFITVTHTPLIRFLSTSNFREEIRNGTELFPHIFSSWVPWNKYQFPGTWLTVVLHGTMCAYGATNMACYDTNVVVIMVFFGGRFELLRERCKLMLGEGGAGVSDQQALDNIRHLHHTHVMLTKYFRLFNSLVSPVMFLYVVMDSLMLCASAYQLTTATNTFQTFLMAEYLIFGIAQLFMFCWHSSDVLVKVFSINLLILGNLYKSEDIIYGPYEGDWWAANLPQRKTFVLFEGQLRTPHRFTAGPFTDLNLSTFITILKGACSYYTLLRE